MDGYRPTTYGDRFADVYDDWYGDVTDTAACVEALASLAAAGGGHPVLELGAGTGRIAVPLSARGVAVHGIDASVAMVERLRAKPGGAAITLTVADMADLPLVDPPPFSVVVAAFNTFFNLPTEAAQAGCLARVADLLAPEGRFVIEAFVPDPARRSERAVTPSRIDLDEVVLSVSDHDAEAQTVTGQHVHLTESGIRMRPWHLRYATPAQLDDMATDAGLTLDWRHAGWREEPFTAASTVHVSAYRLRDRQTRRR